MEPIVQHITMFKIDKQEIKEYKKHIRKAISLIPVLIILLLIISYISENSDSTALIAILIVTGTLLAVLPPVINHSKYIFNQRKLPLSFKAIKDTGCTTPKDFGNYIRNYLGYYEPRTEILAKIIVISYNYFEFNNSQEAAELFDKTFHSANKLKLAQQIPLTAEIEIADITALIQLRRIIFQGSTFANNKV